jgi:hypothetical protein
MGVRKQVAHLELAWSLSVREGQVWETDWYLQRMRAMDSLASIVADILVRSQKILLRLQGEHPDWSLTSQLNDVETSSRGVTTVVAQVNETLGWLSRSCPPDDEEMLSEARSQLDRGEGELIGDIIDRVARGGALVKSSISFTM